MKVKWTTLPEAVAEASAHMLDVAHAPGARCPPPLRLQPPIIPPKPPISNRGNTVYEYVVPIRDTMYTI